MNTNYISDSLRSKVADILYEYRDERQITQEDMADYLSDYGISLSTYRRVERGLKNVTVTMIVKILDAMKIDISELSISNNAVFFSRAEEKEEFQYCRDDLEHFFYGNFCFRFEKD